MKIDHVAIWVRDLEKNRVFYERFFHGKASTKYVNRMKNFESYFISFDNGCRLELMSKPEIPSNQNSVEKQNLGFAHFAISVENKDTVDRLTEEIRSSGYTVIGEPRITGDGYYESVILDDEQNRIEIITLNI